MTGPGPRLVGGRYELRGTLGSGGMGVVHDGWDTRLHRGVAVKELRPELAGQPDVRRRFEAEARAAATLTHPHVVAVHDTGEDAGVPWIVMERLPGPSLAELVGRGPLPEVQVRAALDGVLGALAAAHARGVLHRDVKPGNVLLAADGSVKVTDFGIAKSAGSTDHTATGTVLGTVAYLSPSRLLGAPATVADDLWAAGVLAWEALVGHRPFEGDNLLALARVISDHPAPPLAVARPGVDPVLARVVDRLLAHDPAQRFPDAGAARAALRSDDPGAAATRPVTRVLPAASPATALAPVGAVAGSRGLPGGRTLAVLAALMAVAVVAVLLATSGSGAPSGGSTTPGVPTGPAVPATASSATAAPTTAAPTSTAPTAAPTTAPDPVTTAAPAASPSDPGMPTDPQPGPGGGPGKPTKDAPGKGNGKGGG